MRPRSREIWRLGGRDGHLGFVPDALVEARTDESFGERAAQRVGDTTVAVVDGGVAGFVMVVGDEVDRSTSPHGIADRRRRRAAPRGRAAGPGERSLDGLARGRRGQRASARLYERAGWRDDGPFDYEAAAEGGPITVPCRRYTKHV